jgi:hypothetical protein
VVILLSQVITRLGPYNRVTPSMVERFFTPDVTYLQEFYRQLNDVDERMTEASRRQV